MSLFDAVSSSDLFTATSQRSAQLESLAGNALQSAIDKYMNKDYQGAVQEFKRAIGLAPNSSYSVDAANYMSQAYLQQGDTENAIKAYKTGIRLNPYRDDTHIQLANLYFAEGRQEEAVQEYKEAVRLNPNAGNNFSLGQGHLGTGQNGAAETQFRKVINLQPQDPAGYYGLGQAYSQQERYEDALSQFQVAILKDSKFYNAYAEMGYTYADMGMMDEAQAQVDFLENVNPSLAATVSRYMYKVDSPKISYAQAESTFLYSLSGGTSLAALDSYLANADASKTFTMIFQFDKQMDRESVENKLNWQISRSTQSGPGQTYNFGLPVPDTEITVYPTPDNVYWDESKMAAIVSFTIQQNSNADGTIDPSHIEFKFSGEDLYGNSMDADFDQFMGFSGTA
jgi:tetratricopeptide (TPR) repeat protein